MSTACAYVLSSIHRTYVYTFISYMSYVYTDTDGYGRSGHLEQRGDRHGRHQQGRATGPCTTSRWYDILTIYTSLIYMHLYAYGQRYIYHAFCCDLLVSRSL